MKPYYQWTDEEKYQLAEKLKRTLDDELVDDLMKNMYFSIDQLQQIANTHESWEIWRDEMAAARYEDEVKIIPALREQLEKLKDMLIHLDNAFNWCGCEDGYHMEGPYEVECPACLGYRRIMTDSRMVYALAADVHHMLYPEKNEEHEEPPETGGE